MSAVAELPAADLGPAPPRYRTVPAYTETDGAEAATIARKSGFYPDTQQQDMLDAIFAVDREGYPAAFETGIIACRQNIKTSTMEMAVLAWISSGIRLVVWSAHRLPTSREAFRDLEERFAADDVLRRRVKRVWRGSGNEQIEMRDGARVMFQTRAGSGAKGLTGDKVILDEAFALQEMHIGAVLPTMSTRAEAQVIYGSSAGYADSAVLRDLRDRGRNPGQDPQLAYFEWCAPDPEKICAAGKACTHAKDLPPGACGCDNPVYWRMANPAMFRPDLGEKSDAAAGHRISSDYIRHERRALPVKEFGRERMGWWDDPVEGLSPLSTAAIERARDRASAATDPVAIGVSVSMDRSTAAISVASWRKDGLAHIELVDHRPGTAWTLTRLYELADRHSPCCVVLKPGSPAGAFEQTLLAPPQPGKKARFAVKPPKGWPEGRLPEGQTLLYLIDAQGYAQACGNFADLVTNGGLRFLGLPPPDTSPLEQAMETARTHLSAGSWVWVPGQQGTEVTPLEAATVALAGLVVNGKKTAPPGPFFLTSTS